MSMMGYLAALSAGQITAFRHSPELASDFAETSAIDLLDARMEAMLAKLPPDQRRQIRKAKQAAISQLPSAQSTSDRLDSERTRLAALRPFQPVFEIGQDWQLIHYLLTGHIDGAASPGDALLTGEPIGEEVGYGPARFQDVGQTRAFADFLAPIEADRLVARMDFSAFVRLRIYPFFEVPDAINAQSWRLEIAGLFPRLKQYVIEAAQRGDGLLIWLN